ncbi:MAG: hypothetical protein R2705_04410 [Ilumatobacteraceae bacterium]
MTDAAASGSAKTDWNPLLRDEFDQPYWRPLQEFVRAERAAGPVYPPHPEVFAALHLTPYADTRVRSSGRPYHRPGQAHGLCFSVREESTNRPRCRTSSKSSTPTWASRSPDRAR